MVRQRNVDLTQTTEELPALFACGGRPPAVSSAERLDEGVRGGPLTNDTTSPLDARGIAAARRPAARLKTGQVLIDRFAVVRFIAQGGMGEVYEVEDRYLQGSPIALKTILPDIADDPVLHQRFEREVLLAQKVNHANLCPIYAIFHCEQPPPGFLFLTMKLLPGETLGKRLREKPIPIEEGLAVLRQLTTGLAAIHDAGIIHRDIKPNNIMLDGHGPDVRLFITDFGLARAFEPEVTLSGKGVIAGTPAYMAPELLLGQSPSQASDLFALGIVLHEVFTGERPGTLPDHSGVKVSPRLFSRGLPSFCTSLVTECLDRDPTRRCKGFEITRELLEPRAALQASSVHTGTRLTRRRFAYVAAAAVCGLAGGARWEWDQLDFLLHPLPRKRFVALLNWPTTSDLRLTPMLTGVLSAIKSELARIEAFDRDLFVISPEDVNADVREATHLKEICAPLGANLVLAASGLNGSDQFRLVLRLLDPSSNQALREKTLTCSARDLTALPGKAVHAAASLLDLGRYFEKAQRMEPETQSPAAFTAFQSAESLRRKPNDVGLAAAIEKYQEAVELDPHYALAFAKLAEIYIHLYGLRRDTGALDLASANCERSLELDAGLVEGHLARALLLQERGKPQQALAEFEKTLALDPSNPDTLLAQAQLCIRLDRWADAERTYQRVITERPNFWVTYNDLGYALDQQGKYQEAIKAFHAASVAAPGSAMAFANLGGEYLQTGEFAEATESLKKSLALEPNDLAAANVSLALRYQGKDEEALPFALKAVALNPGEDTNWLELGDCYSSLRSRSAEAKSAYRRAAKEAERHLQIDATHGPSWMLLALYRVKSGSPQNALSLIEKAEALGARDLDSQLYKVRILELIGRREDALATLAGCFRRGATALQIARFPDLQSLRGDPRYRRMVQSGVTATTEANEVRGT